MNKCKTCGQWFDDDKFPLREGGKRRPHCNLCFLARVKRSYYKSRTRRKAVSWELKMKRRLVLQEYTYSYLMNHPCVDCGETNPLFLEFDHLGNKKYNISEIVWQVLALDTLKAEIAKCRIRCAHCHRIKTARELGYWIYATASRDGYI